MDWTFVTAIVLGTATVIALVVFLISRFYAKRAEAARAAKKGTEQERSSSSYGYSSRGYNDEPRRKTSENVRPFARWVTIFLGVLTAVFFVLSCFTTVSANAVAINISLGRYNGVMESGLQPKLPWSYNDEFSTRLNTTIRNQVGDQKNCTTVKATGVEACVDSTTRWTIDYDRKDPNSSKEQVKDLWRNYGDYETLEAKLVIPEITTVFTNVYGGYSASDAFSGGKAAEIDQKLVSQLDEALRPYGIRVNGVTLGNPHLEANAQAQLNRLFTSSQNIQIAANEVEAAKKQAEANTILEASLTPNVLAQHCIDAAREIKPIMITCTSGTSNTPSVIIQPNTAK